MPHLGRAATILLVTASFFDALLVLLVLAFDSEGRGTCPKVVDTFMVECHLRRGRVVRRLVGQSERDRCSEAAESDGLQPEQSPADQYF